MLKILLLAAVLPVSVPQLKAPPIEGLKVSELHDSFDQIRGAGPHEAIDIMEPLGTPVHAVVSGTIAKLFVSKRGGNTIYLFDSAGVFCYYYAHLDRYQPGLTEGAHVTSGQVLGYAGSTGDADPSAPHLHFTIFRLDAKKHWWQGMAVNPYPALVRLLSTNN